MKQFAFSLLLVFVGSLLVLPAHAHPHWGWWWWWRWRCDTEITLSVTTSECARPLENVYIWSNQRYSTFASSSDGVYTVRVCSLPTTLSLWRRGYRIRRIVARHSEETVALTCIGNDCSETMTVETSVSSACGQPLQGVRFVSPNIKSVSSSSPGVYQLEVCSLPVNMTYEAEGYQPQTSVITNEPVAVQLTCSGANCGLNETIVTVQSSDCGTPVSGVNITSANVMSVTETGPGTYLCEVCGMPVTLSLQKEGFDTVTTTVSGPSETITLICTEPGCTAETVTVSVTSGCTLNVAGVVIGGQDVVDASSSGLGTYQIAVCSQPALVKFERIGYASQTANISNDTTVTLTCVESPVIVQDPQSKYRSEGEIFKLCCQAEPAAGVTYKWLKDDAEIPGQTTNTLMLPSLSASDQGLYKCSATSTADPSLPAVMSEEARLTIRATSDSCDDARIPNVIEVFPGCTFDIGQCIKRSCRSSSLSADSCTDDNVCCERREFDTVDCSRVGGGFFPVNKVVGCSCNCPAPSILITGTVEDAATDLPLNGMAVRLVGGTEVATTDANGEFTFSLPSTRRQLVFKASDSTGTYLDNYVVETIPDESYGPINVNIAMVKMAPFVEVDSAEENTLSVSSDPSQPNTGPASLRIPADAYFRPDGTQYTGPVRVSLTYLDPLDPETFEIMPGRFFSLNAQGVPELLVTKGVFSIWIQDDSNNPLILNSNIDVFGTPGYSLYQFDEQTGTWTLIEALPGRRKRQQSQQQIGSFNPQDIYWVNIDSPLIRNEPECYFKIRVFRNDFLEENEIITGFTFIPYVRQVLASGNEGVKYWHGESENSCFRIRCPNDVAQARISATGYESLLGVGGINVQLMPATIDDYDTVPAVKTVLQNGPYNYSQDTMDTSKIIVNTQRALTGPFYLSMNTCAESTFDQPAFWFAKQPEFVESDFYESSEDRCVGKVKISIYSTLDPDSNTNLTNSEMNALSIWSEIKYGLKVGLVYDDGEAEENKYASCFEYRCSVENDMTSVFVSLSNETSNQYQCYFYGGGELAVRRKRVAASFGSRLQPPVLNSTELPSGYFLNSNSDVQAALDQCEADTGNYAGFIDCYPNFQDGSGDGSTGRPAK